MGRAGVGLLAIPEVDVASRDPMPVNETQPYLDLFFIADIEFTGIRMPLQLSCPKWITLQGDFDRIELGSPYRRRPFDTVFIEAAGLDGLPSTFDLHVDEADFRAHFVRTKKLVWPARPAQRSR